MSEAALVLGFVLMFVFGWMTCLGWVSYRDGREMRKLLSEEEAIERRLAKMRDEEHHA